MPKRHNRTIEESQLRDAFRAALDSAKDSYERDRIEDSAANAVERAVHAMAGALDLALGRRTSRFGEWED